MFRLAVVHCVSHLVLSCQSGSHSWSVVALGIIQFNDWLGHVNSSQRTRRPKSIKRCYLPINRKPPVADVKVFPPLFLAIRTIWGNRISTARAAVISPLIADEENEQSGSTLLLQEFAHAYWYGLMLDLVRRIIALWQPCWIYWKKGLDSFESFRWDQKIEGMENQTNAEVAFQEWNENASCAIIVGWNTDLFSSPRFWTRHRSSFIGAKSNSTFPINVFIMFIVMPPYCQEVVCVSRWIVSCWRRRISEIVSFDLTSHLSIERCSLRE